MDKTNNQSSLYNDNFGTKNILNIVEEIYIEIYKKYNLPAMLIFLNSPSRISLSPRLFPKHVLLIRFKRNWKLNLLVLYLITTTEPLSNQE